VRCSSFVFSFVMRATIRRPVFMSHPSSRYIAPAIVQGMTATDDGNAVEVWCTDALDGDDWFFTVDNETELKIYSRVNLVIDANGTPDDFTDDRVIDALFCNDCTED
jgi:hypothetical protein